MPGVKGKSGRKPKRITEIKRWVEANQSRIFELLDVLTERGLKGDREAAVYVIDRVLGKPKVEIDQRVKGAVINLTADDFELIDRVQIEERKLLEG